MRHDLALYADALLPGGILAVDDHAHPDHPGVSEGVAAFLATRRDFAVLADLNRGGALGRKLYLVYRPEDARGGGASPHAPGSGRGWAKEG